VFEFELDSVDTIDYEICDPVEPQDVDLLGPCEPFLSIFCLREGTSTQSNDNTGNCPLDTGIVAYTPGVNITAQPLAPTKPGLPNGPVNRIITSQDPWPVRYNILITVTITFSSLLVIIIIGDIPVIH
jgi:hypothetical protein